MQSLYRNISNLDYVISGCHKIAQADYQQYQDTVTTIGICATFLVSQMWYNHKTEKVVENDGVNILSHFHRQTDHQTAKLRKIWKNYKIEHLKRRL